LGAATTLLANRDLYDTQQTGELLGTVRDEAERLDRFVGNLLDMSRLEAGALGVKHEVAELGELVEIALKRLARRLSGHHIVLAIPSDLPSVSVDPLLLEQALVNLLDNAAKYAPLGSTIAISTHAAENRVVLTIEDEGPGIPADALPHIFDKFYRAKAADSRVAGTGLGLAVARGFVEAFGGTLDAANRTEKSGAALTLSLPLVEQH
jgi:two-component system sensor histidine kinase KdpD